MRSSPNRKPSNGTITLLMLLVIGVVFEHAVSVRLNELFVEAVLVVAVISTIILALRYMGASSA